MFHVEQSDKRLWLSFPFDKGKIAEVKRLGARWCKKSRRWWLHDNVMNRHVIGWKCGRPELCISPPPGMFGYSGNPALMPHQRDGVTIAHKFPRYGFGYDTGTGKTFMGIEIARMIGQKTLVVCPLSIIENAWIEDIRKFAPDVRATNLWAHWRKKTYQRELEQCQIGIVNFESFKSQRPHLEKAGFQVVLIDESSKIKNPKAQITKEIISFCDDVPYVYLFSGTPAPNSEEEYYPQCRVISSDLFGISAYQFRKEYFNDTGFGGFQKELKPEKKGELLNKIASVWSVVRKEDVLDLQERTDNIRSVILSKEETAAHREMIRECLLRIESGEITAANAAVKTMKLRQITSGFIIDETGKPIQIGHSKLTELSSLLEEIGNHQVLIWTQFQFEAGVIAAMLAKAGKTVAVCNGTVSQEDKEIAVRQFKAGGIQYLVAHPRTLGHGVTLTNCSYAVYFSKSYSYEEDYQSRDRIYRYGQKNACSYYYLMAQNTIDGIIMRNLAGKGDVSDKTLEFIKNFK